MLCCQPTVFWLFLLSCTDFLSWAVRWFLSPVQLSNLPKSCRHGPTSANGSIIKSGATDARGWPDCRVFQGSSMKMCRHLQLLTFIRCALLLSGKLFEVCPAWNKTAVAHGSMEKKARYWLTCLLNQRGFVWPCCKPVQQQLFCCISDKVAARRLFAVTLHSLLTPTDQPGYFIYLWWGKDRDGQRKRGFGQNGLFLSVRKY